MKNDQLYLIHIKESIEKIESFIKAGESEFMNNPMVQDAVMRNFEIIGEAAKQITPALKEKYSSIPWRRVAGFRDVLIHNYMGVDVSEVWNNIESHLPDLKSSIQKILQEIEKK